MKPFYIFLFILTLFIFGIVFYAIQSQNINQQKSALDIINQVSPTPAMYLKGTSPGLQNPQQQVQGQQTQQSQQTPQTEQQQLEQMIAEIKQASLTATIQTSKGTIVMELYGSDAPVTVLNFMQRANGKFYNGLKFHRVEDWVVQGGDPKGDGTGGGNLPTEFNDRPYTVGSVGVARRDDPKVQNDSQFFITKKDSPHLNGQYTNFGQVTSGMDVVEKMAIGDTIQSITVVKN